MNGAMRAIRAWGATEADTKPAVDLTNPNLGVWHPVWPKDQADKDKEDPRSWPEFKGPFTGKGVVIGILDTGIDVAFPGFHRTSVNAAGETEFDCRIEAVWDMSKDWKTENERTGAKKLGVDPSASAFGGKRYGWVYSKDDIETHLKALAKTGKATAFATQDDNGHGTRVATCAASHGAPHAHPAKTVIGAAPEATLVIGKYRDKCKNVGKKYSSSGTAGKEPSIFERDTDFINFVKTIAKGRPYVINVSRTGLSNFAWPVTAGSVYPTDDTLALYAKMTDDQGRAVLVSAGNNGPPGSGARFDVPANRTIGIGFETFDLRDKLVPTDCKKEPFEFASSFSFLEYVYVPTTSDFDFSLNLYRAESADAALTEIVSGVKPGNPAPGKKLIKHYGPTTATGAYRGLWISYRHEVLGTSGGTSLNLLRIALNIAEGFAPDRTVGQIYKPDILFAELELPQTADPSRSSPLIVRSQVGSSFGAKILGHHYTFERTVPVVGDLKAKKGAAAQSVDPRFMVNSWPAMDRVIGVGAVDYTWNSWETTALGGPVSPITRVVPEPDKKPRFRGSGFSSPGPLWRDTTLTPKVRNIQKPDICAPGTVLYVPKPANSVRFVQGDEEYKIKDLEDIVQAYGVLDHDYVLSQGTSLAAPIATGVVALMLEKNPKLKASEIRDVLCAQATQPASTTYDAKLGFGVIDAVNALNAVSTP